MLQLCSHAIVVLVVYCLSRSVSKWKRSSTFCTCVLQY